VLECGCRETEIMTGSDADCRLRTCHLVESTGSFFCTCHRLAHDHGNRLLNDCCTCAER
jgi:hypothetical protein